MFRLIAELIVFLPITLIAVLGFGPFTDVMPAMNYIFAGIIIVFLQMGYLSLRRTWAYWKDLHISAPFSQCLTSGTTTKLVAIVNFLVPMIGLAFIGLQAQREVVLNTDIDQLTWLLMLAIFAIAISPFIATYDLGKPEKKWRQNAAFYQGCKFPVNPLEGDYFFDSGTGEAWNYTGKYWVRLHDDDVAAMHSLAAAYPQRVVQTNH